jgi:hypothetical protein
MSKSRQRRQPRPRVNEPLILADLDPVRQSVNTATSAMLDAAGVKPLADVVPLKKDAA